MEKGKGSRPDYIVYSPTEISTGTKWVELGVGFKKENGNIYIQLNCLPVNRHVVLQPNEYYSGDFNEQEATD